MSKPTVGLLGFTGTVGSALLQPLIQAHKDNQISLVILHRESSDLSRIPSGLGIDTRLVYLDEQGVEKTREVVGDLDVVLSTVNGQGIPTQTYLLEALAGSKKLKTFIPSDFGINWTKEETLNPTLDPINIKKDIVKKASELGVPTTSVRSGILDLFNFVYKFVGTDIQNNKIELFNDSLENPLRITSLEYLGYALTQLIQHPEEISNKVIEIYDYQPTGQEIIDTLTNKIHNGQRTEVIEYTQEKYEEDSKELIPAIGAGIRRRWGDGKWNNDEEKVEDVNGKIEGWKGKSLEELIRQYL